ncbi:MocR-like pyridoxine biosynthesis transcription factor PdxR [Labrys wisconsinensis]|uniref:GntR family transcriptional regulator/MocR family aminotransferase n=1 Tax=Labrys wisconsinensis TaxID=425677 RepID=A0ABU0JCW9_9HYPH|nr:PLP-dependent aminotransferase family protein [Labrys wisconsinensis]MDQ0472133.1 GntR family transcriptional regulator/MocR family aminotransferase [Labrys wisconsinensis]
MRKERALLDWIAVARDGSTPLQEQVSSQLRAAILAGRLAPGTPLPSSRTLAADLMVARGTITAIYDRLIGEGLLDVRERSAILVADMLHGSAVDRPATSPAADDAPGDVADEDLPPPYSAFLPGIPAIDIFPSVTWSRLLAARCHNMSLDLAGEGVHVGGYPALREALAGHLRTARGVLCEPPQVIITSSARAALTIVCRLLAKPGDRCLIEEPGYPIARRIVAGCALEAIPVPVDARGMQEPPSLPARLAYLTPTHQLPLGVSLSPDRCGALVAWARREDAWIIEDDYDSEFRYAGRPVVALQHLDPDGNVIHIGTFSKTMFPSLRVAYLVVPRRLARSAAVAAHLHGHEPGIHVQSALADFIGQGHYARHIRLARRVYRRRQKLLVDALNHHLADIVAVPEPPGGMSLFLELPGDIPAQDVQSIGAAESLHLRAASYYCMREPAPNAVHLGFAAVLDRLIEPAVQRLAGVIGRIRTGPPKPC